MLTTTLIALQTFLHTLLPPVGAEFNISLDQAPRYFGQRKLEAIQPTDYQIIEIRKSDQPAQTVGKFIKESQIGEKDYQIKTIVLDPGHGGHDPGCLGAGTQEKHLALAITKKLAAALRTQYPEIRIIMTRETDVFVPLHERARIANQNDADLFISIHCNYMPGSSATKGSETFVMGLHTADHNLNVAKRENGAILLEDNYQQHYDFDPNSPEAHIMLSMFQNAFLEQSILLAEKIEAQFQNYAGRKSRGVKQAGFYVLKATTMPSVLIETGFLSNREEEGFLNTDEGQQTIADAIFNAFASYRAIAEQGVGRSNTSTVVAERPVNAPQVVRVRETTPPPPVDVRVDPKPMPESNRLHTLPTSNSIQFCVQVAAASKPVDITRPPWSQLPYPVELVRESNLYKYQVRGFNDWNAVQRAKNDLQIHFPDAFVVAYKNDVKISIEEARKVLGY